MSALDKALATGLQAVAILEAPPADPVGGYDSDEIAAHYAATDRLIAAFRQLASLH